MLNFAQKNLHMEGDKEEAVAELPMVYWKPSLELYEHSLHVSASSSAYLPANSM